MKTRLTLLLLLCLAPNLLSAAEFRAGAAVGDITPTKWPVYLVGSFSERPADSGVGEDCAGRPRPLAGRVARRAETTTRRERIIRVLRRVGTTLSVDSSCARERRWCPNKVCLAKVAGASSRSAGTNRLLRCGWKPQPHTIRTLPERHSA